MANLDVTTDTLPAGFEFGAYVIGSCIGQGGMARIYRAEHRALRKPVALKVMDNALLERPGGRSRFLREGQAAAAVKHPNVVDITDVGVWQGRPFLVMELLEGEDLERYLSRHKPLAEMDVARLMIPVIAGLATAHGSGVIHRDLKPSNVFLARGPDGETVPKLLDFGISKLASALENLDLSATPLGELMGSPMYMSPEAVRGARDLTPQSDQYSLGVVLYECITGRPPFFGDSLLSVLEAVARGKFESPRKYRPDLSPTLERAILRSMSREPSQRFSTVRDLGRALCDSADARTRLVWTPTFGLRDWSTERDTAPLGPSPLMTGSPIAASFSKRLGRGHGRWAWLGGAFLAALCVGLLFYGRRAQRARDDLSVDAFVSETETKPTVAASAPAIHLPPVTAEPATTPVGVGVSPARAVQVESSSLLAAPPANEGTAPTATAAPVADVASAFPRRGRATVSRAVPQDGRTPTSATERKNAPPEPPSEENRDAPAVDPARSTPPRRVAPALGANQSPILD